ncbi:hypothetical protein [Nannocystis pusilla]|uniref:hypothetical protein n=1 Tax=Nannocystis pusilla TaxID=889268 RepID=UPI003DA3160B
MFSQDATVASTHFPDNPGSGADARLAEGPSAGADATVNEANKPSAAACSFCMTPMNNIEKLLADEGAEHFSRR